MITAFRITAFFRGFVEGWKGVMREKATRERNYARTIHEAYIPLLMADCEHFLRIGWPYDTPDEQLVELVDGTAVALDRRRSYCWRCANTDKVPGLIGARLRLALALAELYSSLAGDRRSDA